MRALTLGIQTRRPGSCAVKALILKGKMKAWRRTAAKCGQSLAVTSFDNGYLFERHVKGAVEYIEEVHRFLKGLDLFQNLIENLD
jgi:predicted 2-oxoglutarate/Fe(II)-dependent dioxygenase YbiX